MLKYSKRFINETKRYNISVLERAMADMIMMGWMLLKLLLLPASTSLPLPMNGTSSR